MEVHRERERESDRDRQREREREGLNRGSFKLKLLFNMVGCINISVCWWVFCIVWYEKRRR